MKNFMYFIIMMFLLPLEVWSQFPLTSKKFIVENYYAPDNYGNYCEYKAHGFFESPVGNVEGRIYFLPILYRDEANIKFINTNGQQFTPSGNSVLAKTIRVPVKIKSELPSIPQIPSIVSALQNGIQKSHYVIPMAKGPNNSFLIYPPAISLQPALIQSASEYNSSVEQQQVLSQAYSQYRPELISLSEVSVEVVIDNEVIASKSFSNTTISSSGVITTIDIMSPSLYQQNRIADGEYDLTVSYKFRDASTSYINARFDARKVINHFIEEVQKSSVNSSSSGWQFLGFGSRKKKIKKSLDISLRENYEGDNYESTTIEMFNASDAMIEEFEHDFFPEISKQKTIDNHKAAAIAAESQGDNALRDLHLQYASALENNDPDLEVNIEQAIAALSAGDYIGFVAHGVRWGSNNASGNSSFNRVVHTNAEIESRTSWTQVRTIPVQHALTENVMPISKKEHNAFLGICEAIQYNYPVYTRNYYGGIQTIHRTGMMPSCIAQGSPAHTAGLVPGMIITSIGGYPVTTTAEYYRAFDNYEPGDYITVTIMEYNGMSSQEKDLSIKLVAGAPRSGSDSQ